MFILANLIKGTKMKKLAIIFLLALPVNIVAQQKTTSSSPSDKNISVERENVKAFLENDLDKYVVYDLMSDGSKVFKDTLDFNEYRDKAIFKLTQNQTILNRQLWAIITLITVVIGLLIFLIRRK